MYAIKRQYSAGKEGVETDHLPGMRRSVLGNAAASEYQTVRSNIKGTLHILRNRRSVLGNAAASEYQTVRSNIKGTLHILRNKERSKLMRKIIAGIILAAGIITLSGCSEASRVSYNLSEQADNFNDIRQVRSKLMRKIIAGIILAAGIITLSGCSEASRVSYNLSEQADNFNDIRQVTVINCITGDTLFQMTGKMSITADIEDNQLEVIVEDEKGEYKKHFIGLSNNVTYVVEDVTAGEHRR